MSILLALFLGFVQGLTEFLPVSSSGHLILFQHLFGLPDDMLFFNIILHIATLLAVVICFRKKLWILVRHPLNKMNLYIIISTAITCTLVVLFKDFIDSTFTYKILPFTFMSTAAILFCTTLITKNSAQAETGCVNGFSSIAVGITQFIAVIPGISRSGTTISTLLVTGVKRDEAAEYSFLISIPIIIASFVYEVSSVNASIAIDIVPTMFAFVAALVSGILAIKLMLKIIKSVKLHWFSFYLVALSIVCFFIL